MEDSHISSRYIMMEYTQKKEVKRLIKVVEEVMKSVK
ncbi:hypothetical protein HRbin06_00792 [archaeon HR06]|nr:hypothetical protein HRbin06_00792 [archaeon HR06]